MENDRARGFSVRSGRIILLGDGTELVPDQNDEELFNQAEEDRDLPSQVQRESPDSSRNEREGTPGPQSKTDTASKSEEGSPIAIKSESPVNPAESSTSGAPEKSTS
jgi:protein phosphatase 2C family protein 2/3